MSSRGCQDDRGGGARRRAADQHRRSGEPRRPERSPPSTSKSTSPSTTTCRPCWHRLLRAGGSFEICARGTRPAISGMHGGVL